MKPAAEIVTLSILAHSPGPLVVLMSPVLRGKYLSAPPAIAPQPLSDPALIRWEFRGFESDWIKILFLQVDEGLIDVGSADSLKD